jgi:hypothetical protein
VEGDARSERKLLQAHVHRITKARTLRQQDAEEDDSERGLPAAAGAADARSGVPSTVPGTQRIWVKTFG